LLLGAARPARLVQLLVGETHAKPVGDAAMLVVTRVIPRLGSGRCLARPEAVPVL
jgi:hypothetical protein